MEDYNWYMAQAAKYHDLANNLDGYQQRQVLEAALKCESKARELRRLSEQPDSEAG